MLTPSEALSAEVRRSRTGNGIKRALKQWYTAWCSAKLQNMGEGHINYWENYRSAADSDQELNSEDEGELDSDDDAALGTDEVPALVTGVKNKRGPSKKTKPTKKAQTKKPKKRNSHGFTTHCGMH